MSDIFHSIQLMCIYYHFEARSHDFRFERLGARLDLHSDSSANRILANLFETMLEYLFAFVCAFAGDSVSIERSQSEWWLCLRCGNFTVDHSSIRLLNQLQHRSVRQRSFPRIANRRAINYFESSNQWPIVCLRFGEFFFLDIQPNQENCPFFPFHRPSKSHPQCLRPSVNFNWKRKWTNNSTGLIHSLATAQNHQALHTFCNLPKPMPIHNNFSMGCVSGPGKRS